jgi:hypothetical protein
MSDFITRLALRQLGQITTIQPRVAPLYAATASESGRSFAEDIEHHPALRAHEAVMRPEKRALQAPTAPPGRLTIDASKTAQPRLVEAHENWLEPGPQLGARPLAAETHLNNHDERLKAEDPAVIPAKVSDFQAAAMEKVLVVPMARTAPVAPVPLVKPTQSESVQRLNVTAPVALESGEDRLREQAQQAREGPVHVTIGRIEVTALTAAAPAKRAPAERKQTMSLDDYLARRQGRDR